MLEEQNGRYNCQGFLKKIWKNVIIFLNQFNWHICTLGCFICLKINNFSWISSRSIWEKLKNKLELCFYFISFVFQCNLDFIIGCISGSPIFRVSGSVFRNQGGCSPARFLLKLTFYQFTMKKGAKKHKPYQIPRKLLVTLLLSKCNSCKE